MSFELEAAAADSLSHLVGARSRHMPPHGAHCKNCDSTLVGPFCHVCGQDADLHKRSILHLIYEAFEGMFELDGRLWRTAPALFLRPGGLARDYMEGRIVRHIPPFRCFLVALVIFIFAAQNMTHRSTVANQRQNARETALLATPQGRATAVAKRRADAVKDFQADMKEAAADRDKELKDPDVKPEKTQAAYAREVAKVQARYAREQHRADRVAQGLPARDPDEEQADASAKKTWFERGIKKATENPDQYWNVVFDWGHRAAVGLLPIVGLSLALVYRRRKDLFVYDHLVVAMNLLSFGFLLSAVGFLLPFSLMGWYFAAAGVWSLVNLFQTLRGGYGSSIPGAAIKTALVWSITGFWSLMLLTGLLVLAIATI
ncbi:DUF3667 domain-containing protein [Phenylobacterium sp.]|uniref:DUF3667 domain-containing protein n=1 Tax=Phenylobacterium sp. TaxID=1871053 RepID=UPI0012133779|nr:DUF3667 domain-containing protein [Phenylobacterium sp.]THD64026.1 MAG: DUF3667 domain-containing protein [Phenylobacterium sp.]